MLEILKFCYQLSINFYNIYVAIYLNSRRSSFFTFSIYFYILLFKMFDYKKRQALI